MMHRCRAFSNRRPPQYSIRSALAVVFLLSASLAHIVERANAQRAGVQMIRGAGGTVLYDYQYAGSNNFQYDDRELWLPAYNPTARPSSPVWLRAFVGEDVLHSVVAVRATNKAFDTSALGALRMLGGVKRVELANISLSDTDVKHIAHCHSLESLAIWNVDVSPGDAMLFTEAANLRVFSIVRTSLGIEDIKALRDARPDWEVFE